MNDRSELTVPELKSMLDHLVTTAGSDSIWVKYVRGRIAALEECAGRDNAPPRTTGR
ncbi:MAG: hypothetical protein ACRDQU_12475 [Pseudonocardiaceae bacterium]